jgi:hypothetical protein
MNEQQQLQDKSFTSNDFSTSKQTILNYDEIGTFNRFKTKQKNNDSDYIMNMSFLLSIFDNIVGPKIVHYWSMESNESKLNDYLLKYIAIHTLNGELYLVIKIILIMENRVCASHFYNKSKLKSNFYR